MKSDPLRSLRGNPPRSNPPELAPRGSQEDEIACATQQVAAGCAAHIYEKEEEH